MKKNTLYFATCFIFCFQFSACSLIDSKKEISQDEKFQEENPQEENSSSEQSKSMGVDDALKRLNKLAEEAKQVGEHAVNYLASDLYMKASAASMQGDVGSALILFKFLSSLRPNDQFLKFKYSVELVKVGKLDEAKPLLAEVFKKSGNKDEKSGLILGGVYTALKEQKKARNVYEVLWKHNPKSEESCVYLAKTYAIDKEIVRAKNLLSLCEKRMKDNGIFSFYKGKIALEQNRLDEAQKHFVNSLRIDKDYYQSAVALGHIYEAKQNPLMAVGVYKKFLEKSPENPVILARLVQNLFMQEKYGDVIPYLEKLQRLDPENSNIKIKLGILYTDTKEYEKAKKVFGELLKENPKDDKVLYYMGALYQDTYDFEKSISYYELVSKEGPLYTDSVLQIASLKSSMAQLYDQREEIDYNEKFFEFVEEKEKEIPQMKVDFSIVKATYFEGKQKFEEALKVLKEVKNEKEFNDNHRYYMATILDKLKKYDEANNLVWEMIEKDPNNAHNWNFLGYSLLERNEDFKKAHEYILKAIKLRPSDGFIRDSLGWYYFKTGNTEQALKELKKARELVADDVSISKHLAEVYHAQKKYELAKKYYMEALKNSRAESDRQEVLRSMEKLEKIRRPAAN